MTVRRRKTTNTRPPIENHEHLPNSRAVPAISAESGVLYPQLWRVVGIGLFVVATVVLFGISIPFVPLPSSLGALAALALGTLLVGMSPTGRGEMEPAVQASLASDEARVE